MSILDEIIEKKRSELDAQSSAVKLSAVKNRAAHQPAARSLIEAVTGPDLAVIAEFKRRSPSAGAINETADPAATARLYEAAGAAALSVLTERSHFGGSLADLDHIRRATSLPILRKDFIFDDYQIYESRALGADAILLIAGVLDGSGLRHAIEEAAKAGLEALVEAHDEEQLQDALAAGAHLVGINNRDLNTFDVDLSTVERLRPTVPDGIPVVSESGCRSAADVERLRTARVDAVLIGGTLMSSEDIEATMTSLFGRE